MNLAVEGSISDLAPADEARLFRRGRAADPDVERAVAGIVADVRARGDDALRELTRRFERIGVERLEVPRAAWEAALESLDAPIRAALEQAVDAVTRFHRAQLPLPLEVEVRPGVRLGRRAEPLRRVGVYVPGGRASYPSSVLMGVVPARVAGVDEIIVCSPPGPDGLPPAAVLAACALAGAGRVFALGGAGAIAALAFGTRSVPRVDKVVGPGNAYVNEAKRQLERAVAIDSPAGPSEVLVIADDAADPELAAAELVAQAEHDPDAAAVLVATDESVVEAVRAAVVRLAATQPRCEIIAAALAGNGALLYAVNLEEALDFATRYAPEHLVLLVREPRRALERVRAAGTILLGAASSAVFGDYLTGANHVLPTGGLARTYSGLSTLDFLRWSTYQEIADDAAAALAGPTATFADAEGLPAHAAAARLRNTVGVRPGIARRAKAARTPPAGAGAGARPVRFRSSYRELELYQPNRPGSGQPAVAVDLSDNTSLFGPSPAAVRTLARFDPEALTRYPSVYADRLKGALAEMLGVAAENVATGCGSDDVIDSAIRAFCEAGDVVAYPDPTFGMLQAFARMNGTRPVGVPLDADFALDPDALVAARGRVTYLCRPNNPTGNLFERAAVERLAAGAAGVVLVDEAYTAFAEDDLVDLALAADRVIVLRTLSKAYGLAALRVGFAVGPAALVREIEKSRGPYKISAASETAALAALREDGAWVRANVGSVRRNRSRLASALAEIGLRAWPSAANFLLVRTPEQRVGAAHDFAAALRARQVAVRPFPGLPHAGECIRVSVGPWSKMERFLAAVGEVTGGE